MPDPFDSKAIVDALLVEAESESIRFNRTDYIQKIQALHRLVVVYVTNALCEWNLYSEPGERHDVPELIQHLHISDRHEKLLNRWLNILCDERLLVRDDHAFISTKPLPAESPTPLLNVAMQQWPEATDLVNCMKGCGENLGAILTGEKSALEFLFPAGSFNVAEAIYERSTPWRYCNVLLAKALEVIAKRWDRDRPLRILEVGAGVGGTTKSLLPVLKGVDAEYVFTDVSKFFLSKANKKFGDYSGLHRQILDLEQEPGPQGFRPRSFDVIVAANVLHATTDIRVTAQRVYSLLQPEGILLLMELTENETWLDMIFGLLEGWARHSDDIRTDRPTLSIPQWQTLLKATGFSTIHHFPADLDDAHAIRNTVFIVKAGPDNESAQ
jgi:epothilone polyketide synthase E